MTPKKIVLNAFSFALFASSSVLADNSNQRGSNDRQPSVNIQGADRGGGRGGNGGADRGGGRGDNSRPNPPSPNPGRQLPPGNQRPPERQQPGNQRPPENRRPPEYGRPPVGPRPPEYGRPPIVRRPPIRRIRPVQPLPPRYVPVLPNHPWQPGRPGFPGNVEREYEYLGQVIENGEVPLRSLFDIDQDFYGYTIDSIQVEVGSAGGRYSKLSLEVNGIRVDSESDPQGWVTLDPGTWDQIGTEVRTLRLSIQGRLLIGGIYINLRRFSDDGGYSPAPGAPEVQLSVPGYLLPRRLSGNDRLSLGQMINLNDYVGYKFVEMIVEGEAIYNNAILDVLVGGLQVAPSLVFDGNFRQTLLLRSSVNQTVNANYDSIVLMNRGDLNIERITIKLSRW